MCIRDSNYLTGSASVKEGSAAAAGYRRTRELNNLACQRFRKNKKLRMLATGAEMKRQQEKNKQLVMQAKSLEEEVKGLKDNLISLIRNQSHVRPVVLRSPSPFDLELLLNGAAARELDV